MTTLVKPIKVLSYNIHKGFNQFNNQYLLEKMRFVIKEFDADLVFLQEVIGENKKHLHQINNWTPGTQFEYLADTVWPYHSYGKNSIYSHGHHGNAILSKTPFDNLGNINISQFSQSQRGMLIGKTHSGIYVICVHLGLFSWERKKQLNTIIDKILQITKPEDPIILAGDFNDWNLQAHRALTQRLNLKEAHTEKHGRLARSYPLWAPLLKMDRIYSRGFVIDDAICLSTGAWLNLSDHCALYASLQKITPI